MTSQTKRFYILRHGETSHNAAGIVTGKQDVLLTERGKQQAARCRDDMAEQGIVPDVIVCSMLQRTKDAADIINQDLNCPITRDDRLNEVDFGSWEGQSWEELNPIIAKIGRNPPDGESEEVFYNRIHEGITAQLTQHKGLIVFALHGGVIKSLLAKQGLRPSYIENCKLYEFEYDPSSDEFRWLEA